MLRFITQRILWGVFTMWAISVLTFVIIQLPPGDFASTYVARVTQGGGSGIDVDTLRSQLGLDQSMAQRYFHWIGRAVRGDFGQSLSLNRPVADIIGGDIIFTAVVALSAIVITWLIALPIGVYSAVNRYSAGDYALTVLGFLGLAIPNFLL